MTYLCVDGGQTRTGVCLLEDDGSRLARWEEDALIHPARPGGMDRLERIVVAACRGARVRLDREPVGACFSLTGYAGSDARVPELVERAVRSHFSERVRIAVVPDYVGNWFSAAGGRPGVVVISGGGSVAYGRNAAGQESRVGGWGHLLGDEGSGYWIGLEAARAALRSSAGVIPLTTLERAVWASLEVADSGELTQRVYSGAVTDRDLALLVPVVEREAAGGDEAARGILDRAAGHLFALVRAAVARLGPLPVYPSGGAFRVEGLRERFERLASGAGLEVRLAREGSDPMDGLLIIARHGPAYVVGG